jgi:hypothetical protein
MNYMLLIYENEANWLAMSPEEQGKIFGEYMQFTQEITASGHFVSGDPLDSTASATTVRVRDGKAVTTDGPFAETREQLGGYYVIRAENLDVAIDIASRIPAARVGSIEIRPVPQIPTGE